MKLKFWIPLLVLLSMFGIASAQKAGFKVLSSTTELQAALSKNAQATNTITSDFTQVKNMKMLNDKVTSKGKFHYKKQDKVRIEYTTPFQYLLIMNGGMISVKENGKTTKVNTKNSLTMQSVNRIMMDCMRGTVYNNKDFKVASYASATQYLLDLTPVSSSVKGLFKNIEVYINKSDNQVAKLVMTENGGDYTIMTFSNRKINASLADALFSTR